jgi:hypothetical protein
LLGSADLRVVLVGERFEVHERPNLAAVSDRLAVVDVGGDPMQPWFSHSGSLNSCLRLVYCHLAES